MSNIVIYSLKGGSGKSVSTCIIKEVLESKTNSKWKIVSNDPYPKYHKFYGIPEEEYKVISPDEPDIPIFKGNNLMDFGGRIDKRIPNVLKQADVIIIPTLYDKIYLQSQLDTLREIQRFTNKVILLILKTKGNELQPTIERYREIGITYPILQIKESRCVSNMSNKKKKILDQLSNPNKYTQILKDQLDELGDTIIKQLKG